MFRQLVIIGALSAVSFFLVGNDVLGRTQQLDPLLAFGFIVLTAFTFGELAERVHLPHITGYLLAGVICGPYASGLLSDSVVSDLKLFDILAVALIGLSVGGAIDVRFLRKTSGVVFSVLSAQFVAVIGLITILLVLLALVSPQLGFEFLEGSTFGAVIGAALLVGTIASAFSPAAVMAVLHETRAKGGVTDSVLGISVLNNVVVVMLFAAVLAGAQTAAGFTGDGAQNVVWHLVQSLGGAAMLGLLLGALIAGYIRWIGKELLLFVVGVCFAASWISRELGADEVLAFIVAGFVVSNFTRFGEVLSVAVNRLSLPVYVLFFFLAGAGLHLDALGEMWPLALLVFFARLYALRVSTRWGASVANGPIGLVEQGWLGFGAQAGIALSMAIVVGHSFGEIGPAIEVLAVAGIALNEVVGPVLLKLMLGWVGESESARTSTGVDDAVGDVDAGVGQQARVNKSAGGWPEAPVWGEPEIDDKLAALRAALLGVEEQALQVSVRPLVAGSRRFLERLRREFLLSHRRLVRIAAEKETVAGIIGDFRDERRLLSAHWRVLVSQYAKSFPEGQADRFLNAVLPPVETLVEDLPERCVAPLPEGWSDARAADAFPMRFARRRKRWALRFGGKAGLTRRVPLRAVARYNLSGGLTVDLSETVGLLSRIGEHGLLKARGVFDAYGETVEAAARHSDARAIEILAKIRDEVDDAFRFALGDVDQLGAEITRVVAHDIGRSWRHFVRKLEMAGTPELPARSVRYAPRYAERERVQAQMRRSTRNGHDALQGLAGSLQVALELAAFRSRVIPAVETARETVAQDAERDFSAPFREVWQELDDLISSMDDTLIGENEAVDGQLAARLDEGIQTLLVTVEGALQAVQGFRERAEGVARFESVRRALAVAMDELSDHVVVIAKAVVDRGRGFVPDVELRTVRLRDEVSAFVDVEVDEALLVVATRLDERAEQAADQLAELLRVVTFNADLAKEDLVLNDQGTLKDGAREQVRETLVGTLRRVLPAGGTSDLPSDSLPDAVGAWLEEAVLDGLARLTEICSEGRFGEMRRKALQSALERRGREWLAAVRAVDELQGQLERVSEEEIGARATRRLTEFLGIRRVSPEPEPGRWSDEDPVQHAAVPRVYRRLFGDRVLDAGDLLAGRSLELDAAMKELSTPGRARCVAVLGYAGEGKTSAIQSLKRRLSEQLPVIEYRFGPDQNIHERIDRLVNEAKSRSGVVFVVSGIPWVIDAVPGGFEELRRILACISEDERRNGWLISVDRAVWSFASRFVPLETVFPRVLLLGSLGLEQLRDAVLSRHALSGYRVAYERPSTGVGNWLAMQLRGSSTADELYERATFEELHEESRGNLRDGLRLWLASVRRVSPDGATLVLGPVPKVGDGWMRRLVDEDFLTLLQVSRVGRITAEQHARMFGWEPMKSRAAMDRLARLGLLQKVREEEWALRAVRMGMVHRALLQKGLLK